MNLKPMSLNQGSKTNTSNKQLLNYVKSGDKDDSPRLILGEFDTAIHLVGEHCVQARTNLKDEYYSPVSQSRVPFTYLAENFSSLSNQEMQNIQELDDILVLGTLCEVLSKLGIPINALTENAELVKQFVKESFEYYGYTDHQFNLDRAIKLLSNPYTDNFHHALKSYILLGKAKNMSIDRKAQLMVNREQITLIYGKKETDSIIVPISLSYSALEPTEYNYLYNAVIWFLILKNGFYFEYFSSIFYTFEETSRFEQKNRILLGSIVFNPNKCIEIF